MTKEKDLCWQIDNRVDMLRIDSQKIRELAKRLSERTGIISSHTVRHCMREINNLDMEMSRNEKDIKDYRLELIVERHLKEANDR